MNNNTMPRMIAILLLAATCCQAQPDSAGRGPGGPRDRERRTSPFGPNRPAQILTRIEKDLNLNPTQGTKAKELFDTYEATVKALREEYRGSGDDAEKWKAFREEMQAARQAGDNEKVREVMDRMRTARTEQDAKLEPVRQQVGAAQKTLKDGMLALLTEQQKSGFERIWDEEFAGKRRVRVPSVDPKILKSVIDDLKGLNSEQKEKIEAAFKTYHESSRDSQSDTGAKQASSQRLSEDVFGALDQDQSREAMKLVRERLRKTNKTEEPKAEEPPPSNP